MSDQQKAEGSSARSRAATPSKTSSSASGTDRRKGQGQQKGGKGLGAPVAALIGLLAGLLLGIVLIWVLQGNPFSAANQVVYTDVVVASVTDAEDSICWAQDPQRRDSPQECAILALDPELAVPQAGDVVTIGMVELRTPDGAESTQVVHVSAAGGEGIDVDLDATPTPSTQDGD